MLVLNILKENVKHVQVLKNNQSGKKKIKDLNNTEKDILRFVSILDGETMPVGSFLFREHYYPGDIDMCETIVECCNKNEAKSKIAKRIVTTVKRILLHRPKVFFADFKAGYDKRFNPDNFNLKKNIENKDIIKIKDNINLYKNIISEKDYNLLINIIENEFDNEISILNFNKIIHEYRTVRWDFNEILNGSKIHNGILYKFEDAIACKEVVKLDIWYKLDDRYIEVTNFMNICVSNKQEIECKKYLSEPMGNLVSTLMSDINKYFIGNNWLKCLKRIWSLLNYIEKINTKIFNKLKSNKKTIIPIFKSESAKLSQIQSDLEVVLDMVNKFKKKSKIILFPASDILYYLLGIQNKLKYIIKSKSTYIEKNIDLHDLIDQLFSRINNIITSNTVTLDPEKYWDNEKKKLFINILEEDVPKIMDFINHCYIILSVKWLKDENINLKKLIKNIQEKLFEGGLIDV